MVLPAIVGSRGGLTSVSMAGRPVGLEWMVGAHRHKTIKMGAFPVELSTGALEGVVQLQCATPAPVLGELAGLDSATAGKLAFVLKPTLSLYSLMMIVRIVMTWYPEVDGKEFPWSIPYTLTGGFVFDTGTSLSSSPIHSWLVLVMTKPVVTFAFLDIEPLLSGTRKVVKPFNGLDVSPIVWVALLSFFSEILTGPQGILSLIERKGI